MKCYKCKSYVPTWMMKKKVLCNECGQEYVARNYQSMWLFSVLVVAPILKIWVYEVFSSAVGDFAGFLLTLITGVIILVIYFKFVVRYE